MSAYLEIDTTLHTAILSLVGAVEVADLHGAQRELRRRHAGDYRILVELGDIERFAPTGDDLREIVHVSPLQPAVRLAIWAPSEEAFRIGRMTATLHGLAGRHGVRVFRDRAEAVAWLLASRN